MSFLLNDLDAEELVILASSISLSISNVLKPSEIKILIGMLNSIGSLLALIAVKQGGIDDTEIFR